MKLIISILILLGICMAGAANVDLPKVKQVSENFLKEKGYEIIIWEEVFWDNSSNPNYYILNFNSSGFVIAAAEDSSIPILAYSFEGKHDPEHLPIQFQDILESWSEQIIDMRQRQLPAGNMAKAEWNRLSNQNPSFRQISPEREVTPLLSCIWGQDSPWSDYCPYGPQQANPFVYSGCVALSMAQIIYYWQHPAQGMGQFSYNHEEYGQISCNFSELIFDYELMGDSSCTSEIQELQWACGVSVRTNWGDDGSGAQISYGDHSARFALENYFSYDPGISFKLKSNYSTAEYEELLRTELDNGQPVIYSGIDGQFGHAFNIDGYQDSYFHFNFGWEGYENGYYYLSNINPGGYNFNSDQGGLFGIFPLESMEIPRNVQAEIINGNDVLVSWEHPEVDRSLLGFNVYKNGLHETLTDNNELSYTLENLEFGEYLLWITAQYITGESSMSEMISAVIQPTPLPVANAGSDTTVYSGDLVILDSSGSYDQGESELSYQWSYPAEITLSDPTARQPEFIAIEVSEDTDFVFSLVVFNGELYSEPDEVIVTIKKPEEEIPVELILNFTSPNPFKWKIEFSFSLPEPAHTSLIIYDIKGRRVKKVTCETLSAGENIGTWDGSDEQGRQASEGIYLYQLSARNKIISGKVLLLR